MPGKGNRASTGPSTEAQQNPMPLRRAGQPRIQFISGQNVDGTVSKAARKLARSYAAKESHALARRERMITYQNAKRMEAEQATVKSA
jgi:hypothetical protein